jgi:hypothetical protein
VDAILAQPSQADPLFSGWLDGQTKALKVYEQTKEAKYSRLELEREAAAPVRAPKKDRRRDRKGPDEDEDMPAAAADAPVAVGQDAPVEDSAPVPDYAVCLFPVGSRYV